MPASLPPGHSGAPAPEGGYPPPAYPGAPPSLPAPPEVQGQMLASWGQRAGALVIDLVLGGFGAAVAATAIARPDVQSLSGGALNVRWDTSTVSATLLIFLFLTMYFTLSNGSRRGQTFGKTLVGIAVRDAQTGESIGAARALGRSLATLALYLVLIVPWLVDGLWPLWDARRQALHDKVAGSVVVSVRPRV